MADLICRKTMMRCQTQGMCSPHGGCQHSHSAAPHPPAGVDGLNTDRNAAFKACPESGCDWGSFYLGWKARGEVEQAIIDGLRGKVAELESTLVDNLELSGKRAVRIAGIGHELADAISERDQQAQRIGELEWLLRHAQKQVPAGSGLHMRIDSALSAGKEG